MLKDFAKICLQIFTSFSRISDVAAQRDSRPTLEKGRFYPLLAICLANLKTLLKNPAIFICLRNIYDKFACKYILKLSAKMRNLFANISTGWNSWFQHFGLSARLVLTPVNNPDSDHWTIKNMYLKVKQLHCTTYLFPLLFKHLGLLGCFVKWIHFIWTKGYWD